MSCSPAIVVPLPGVEGYRLVELELAQRERPDISDGAYVQWGAFQLVTTGAPARLLVIFDSKPGPLGWALPEMEKETYQLGVLGTRVIWLSLAQPISGAVKFRFKSAIPARIGQVLLATNDGSALPWPPPRPGPETWRREQAGFSATGPAEADGRWAARLTLEFDGKSLPSEFLVVCSCPRDGLEVVESSDSPRAADCLIEPGPDAMSLIITVCPTSRVNYDHIVLQLTGVEAFRLEKVERLFRP